MCAKLLKLSVYPLVKAFDPNSTRDATEFFIICFFCFGLGLWGEARPACCGLAPL